MESTIDYTFSTALTTVAVDNGQHLGDKIEVNAKLLRGRIMSLPSGDGIVGMWVKRYGMSVEFLNEIISAEQVSKVVQEGINWLAKNGDEAFPQQDEKAPTVTVETSTNVPSGIVSIEVQLNTNLYSYVASKAERDAIEEEFAKEILEVHGTVDLRVYIDSISMSIRSSVNTADVFQAHILSLLKKHAGDEDSKFLPYVKHETPQAEWSVRELTS